MVFILSPSTYFDALVKQLKVQEYTFRSLYMINSAKRPTSPLLLLLLYNIYIAHYITITLSASHYKTIARNDR